ncbi:MAG: hypothetical protein A3H27_01145 [Acidobacteria bacterium RIFCSPLOWO2_02_FULL_59_13]|nr:MAG: hypothetical protein A3H27_01145 [Acidobacteria bacterium RIFCSPLOWO2_02_FULL_59_13]
MLGAHEIYREMTQIEQRYREFRDLFHRFKELAITGLTADDCPVKSITFENQDEENYFYGHFAGKCVRFSFSMERDKEGIFRGDVKCNLVDPSTKERGFEVGNFSFNGRGNTKLKLPGDGDEINISHDAHAAYIALHMLYAALGKQ